MKHLDFKNLFSQAGYKVKRTHEVHQNGQFKVSKEAFINIVNRWIAEGGEPVIGRKLCGHPAGDKALKLFVEYCRQRSKPTPERQAKIDKMVQGMDPALAKDLLMIAYAVDKAINPIDAQEILQYGLQNGIE